VRGRISLARARTPWAADVEERHAFGLRLLEPVADRPPGTHVLRLLLRPDDLAEVRVPAQERRRLLDRERIELLDPGDGDEVGARAVLVTGDVVVDLSRTKNEPGDLLVIRLESSITGWNPPFEPRASTTPASDAGAPSAS
jgi:hypothetical protein